MSNNQVHPLNYCTHAIEDLKEYEQSIRYSMPQSARSVRGLIDLLQHSVKFILPNCCSLIDPEQLKQSHMDLLRLPFPCVAFEAPWETEDGVEMLGDYEQAPSTRRIALAWEANPNYELIPGMNSILNYAPEGGVFVVPIYWANRDQRWQIPLGGVFVPYNNTVRDVDIEHSLPASRIAHAAMSEAGRVGKKAKQYSGEPFNLFPEMHDSILASLGSDPDKVAAQIILDANDEVQTVIQACSVINCANVITADVNAPTALNKKRQEKGKAPFFSYKVLQLTDERRAYTNSEGKGTHGSPRMHLRRGHLRQLKERTVWVRPAMINANSDAGAVYKDYAVPAPRAEVTSTTLDE
jgi:hypothetical protein